MYLSIRWNWRLRFPRGYGTLLGVSYSLRKLVRLYKYAHISLVMAVDKCSRRSIFCNHFCTSVTAIFDFHSFKRGLFIGGGETQLGRWRTHSWNYFSKVISNKQIDAGILFESRDFSTSVLSGMSERIWEMDWWWVFRAFPYMVWGNLRLFRSFETVLCRINF